MRSHIPGLSADPQGHCLRRQAAEKCCCCCRFVQEKTHLALCFFISPPYPLVPRTPPFRFPHKSWVRRTHLGGFEWTQSHVRVHVCVSVQWGLAPHRITYGENRHELNLPVNTLAREEGKVWWPVMGVKQKKKPVEYLGQQWSNGRNDEYRAFVMIHEGGDDSSFLVPRSLLSPKQMTFIKGWTAGVRFPRLKTRNGNKTWEGEKKIVLKVRDPRIPHICFCNMTAAPMNLSERFSGLEQF